MPAQLDTERFAEQLRSMFAHDLSSPRATKLSDEDMSSILKEVIITFQGKTSLAPAMASSEVAVPAGIARSLQATENAWRSLINEFGLFTSTEASLRSGSKSANRVHANELRRAGKLLAVKRLNAYRFPGFQFAPHGGVLPVIQPLVALATELDWPLDELTLWLCSPTGYFDDERPVEHLGDTDFLEKVRNSATVEW